jgi:hypothetical protein
MIDACASQINAKQGTIKAQNTIKLGQINKAIDTWTYTLWDGLHKFFKFMLTNR